MNTENAPKIRRQPAAGSGSSRIDLVSQKAGEKRRTSAAACVSPELVEAIRASAERSGASVSSFVREAVEASVKAEHAAAGVPWPPAGASAKEAPLAATEA